MGMFQDLANGVAGQMAFDEQRSAESAKWHELQRAMRAERANAVASLNRGSAAAGNIRSAGAKLEGQQRVAQAVNGLDVSSGTAAGVQNESRMYTELDAAMTMNNARAEAFGHETTLLNYKAEADRIWKSREGGVFGQGAAYDGQVLRNANSMLTAAKNLIGGGF